MDSEEFKRMRWAKLARKRGIPYFEEPTTLETVPIDSIEIPQVQLLQHEIKVFRTEDQRSRLISGSR
jgi:hypothetical protein